MLEQAAFGLFMSPGMGKTGTSLAAFSLLKQEGLAERMLVIAPLRVTYSVWPAEIRKWENFNHLRVVILHGKDKEQAVDEDADIYVINPEGLLWFLSNGAERLSRLRPDVLCIDESSRFKSYSSKRFKLLRDHLHKFRRRWILTGTPVPNGLMDLFSQIYILDRGAALGKYISHFRSKWFYPSGYGGYTWVPAPDAFERITERIRPLCRWLSPEDHLDLPELRVGGQWDIYVELPKPAMDLYRSLENDFYSKFYPPDNIEERVEVMALNAASAGMKCRQVANGAVYYTSHDDDGIPNIADKPWRLVHDAKLDALESLVEELGGAPILVFYEFQHDAERIMKRIECECLTGTSAKKGDEIIQRFNRGEVKVLLAHPASAAHGLNLQDSCQYVCWFSMTWNLENYLQGIQRVYRQGQTLPVTVYRILATDTLDSRIAETLVKKDVSQNKVLKALL